MPDAGFWAALDRLLGEAAVVIDRPKDSRHTRFATIVHPLDDGYLDGTSATGGGGIDLWRGSDPARGLEGVAATVDLTKRDTEIKLPIGSTQAEVAAVEAFHNGGHWMKRHLVRRLVRRPDGSLGGDEGPGPPIWGHIARFPQELANFELNRPQDYHGNPSRRPWNPSFFGAWPNAT